jgi:TRAP-type mannitol/chloroaromatic compound transport system substrate-binding protein
MTTSVPRTNIIHEIHAELCKRIEAASGGQFIIEDFAGDELYPSAEVLANLERGTNEIAGTYADYFSGTEMGFSVRDAAADPLTPHWKKNMLMKDPEWKSVYDPMCAQFGIMDVGGFSSGTPDNLHFTKDKPMTFEEFAGIKIRTMGQAAIMYDSAKMETMWLPGGEIYTALQTGTIECCEYAGWKSNWDLSLQEVTKYIMLDAPHAAHGGSGSYFIRIEDFNALPDNLKQLLLDECDLQYLWTTQYIYSQDYKYKEKFMEYPGIEIYAIPASEHAKFFEAAEYAFDEVAKDYPTYAKLMQIKRKMAILLGSWRDAWYDDPVLVEYAGK